MANITDVISGPPTNATESTDPDSNNTGVIVGGVVGGVLVVVLVIIVILVVLYRRRQNCKKSKKRPMAPGTNTLETSEIIRARNLYSDSGGVTDHLLYANLDSTGAPDEKTDPMLDDEGYIIMTKKKKKGKKNKADRHKSPPLDPTPPAPAAYTDTETEETDMEAPKDMTYEYMSPSAITKQSQQDSSKLPQKKNSDKEKQNVKSKTDSQNVQRRSQSLSEDTGTDTHYANVESKGGGLRHYANVEQTKTHASSEISEMSEQLYANP